jgi:hypothetical protein
MRKLRQLPWYSQTAAYYLIFWVTGLVCSLTGVGIYIFEHYTASATQLTQHTLQLWPLVLIICFAIGTAQLPAVLGGVAIVRFLRHGRGRTLPVTHRALYWYLFVTGGIVYLTWTITIVTTFWAISFAMLLGSFYGTLAVAGFIVFGVAELCRAGVTRLVSR